MSPEENQPSAAEHMARLERRANVIRARLLRTVDALEVRHRQIRETVSLAKRAAPRIGVSILGATALAAASVLAVRALILRRRRTVPLAVRARRVLVRLRVGVEPRLSFRMQLAQRLSMTVATLVVTEVTRRVLKNLVDGRLPDGRLAAGEVIAGSRHALTPGTER